MFTLWTLIESSLLCLNAVCILHEERFLAKCKFSYSIFASNATMFNFLAHFLVGWGRQAGQQDFGAPTAKDQVLNLIRSIRTVAKSEYHITKFL